MENPATVRSKLKPTLANQIVAPAPLPGWEEWQRPRKLVPGVPGVISALTELNKEREVEVTRLRDLEETQEMENPATVRSKLKPTLANQIVAPRPVARLGGVAKAEEIEVAKPKAVLQLNDVRRERRTSGNRSAKANAPSTILT